MASTNRHDEDGGASPTAQPALGLPGLAFPSIAGHMLVPPLGFAHVSPGIYRGGYPIACNLPFLRALGLRSIVCLCPEDLKEESRAWAKAHGIRLYCCDVGDNMEPFVSMRREAVTDALSYLLDKENHPVLVHCLKGKNRTGCVVGCLRRLEGWSLSAIFDEYTRYTGPPGKILDLQFIELFDADV
ncbi:unnamed protein product [Phaeothamnion confervicola]